MNAPEVLKPLKTWSHLAGRRRKPSEYEIVSTNLHFSTDNPDAPFELDPNFGMAQWFKQHRNASPLQHPDWNAFRDPDEMVYRTYN
ncbi:MAG TPA: toluene monooxygenase, partial [Thauera aminoaromatica]|nr:toluene monooxygenase [Thauera aminoaromatica]